MDEYGEQEEGAHEGWMDDAAGEEVGGIQSCPRKRRKGTLGPE